MTGLLVPDTVEIGIVRLEIEKRGPVERIQPAYREPVALAMEKIHDSKADRIRPLGRTGGKDTMLNP